MQRQFILIFLIILLTFSSLLASEEHELLSGNELDQFIKDTPTFISKIKNNKMDRLLITLFLHPELVDENKPLQDILVGLSWDPQRYAYIFSRVIIGGFIRDMGEFGEGKLKFLKEQLVKWQQSNEPEPQRSQMIGDLTRSIHDLEEIVARTKAIPKPELLLMWSKRDALNDVLMGKLPIGKKKFKALP